MKFMHISDVHLGVKPDAGKAWSEKRAQDIWDSFAEMIEIAAEESPDFLLISGDLFHKQPLKRELKEVCGLFARIPQTKVLLMAGNHDYIQQNSFYRTCEWPENVCFFPREEVMCFDFPEQNTTVYGLSYWHREIRQALYDEVFPKNTDRINILLAHGGDERHIPFSVEKILRHGFDYMAAGHIHKGGQLVQGRAVMAGALEPTDCNDTGAHGYWIGDIGKTYCEVSFYPVRKCEYCHEAVEVTPGTTGYDVTQQIKELLAERPAYQYFRICLQGYKDPDVIFDLNKLSNLERIVDVTEQLRPDYDYDKLLAEHENSLLGAYIAAMQKKRQDPVAAKALEYGVSALLGHEYCEVSFYPVRKCEYCHEAVEVTPGTTGYDVTQQIKELLAERPAYQYFRICLQGYKDPDVIFDLNKLSNLERIVDVTEQLRPDYDYDKLLAEHENSLLGAYIAAMQKKRQDPVAAKALEYGVSALLGHEICR